MLRRHRLMFFRNIYHCMGNWCQVAQLSLCFQQMHVAACFGVTFNNAVAFFSPTRYVFTKYSVLNSQFIHQLSRGNWQILSSGICSYSGSERTCQFLRRNARMQQRSPTVTLMARLRMLSGVMGIAYGQQKRGKAPNLENGE